MNKQDKVKMMKQFVGSSYWDILMEYVDGQIEKSREVIEGEPQERLKERVFDRYDLERIRIKELKLFRGFPEYISGQSESPFERDFSESL